jgi:hypothetical protein
VGEYSRAPEADLAAASGSARSSTADSSPTAAAHEPSAAPDVPESDTPLAPVSSPETQRPRTRLQSGIVKPKQFTDGTFRYGHLCTTGEPQSVQALGDPKWKKAMEEEYAALLKNGT